MYCIYIFFNAHLQINPVSVGECSRLRTINRFDVNGYGQIVRRSPPSLSKQEETRSFLQQPPVPSHRNQNYARFRPLPPPPTPPTNLFRPTGTSSSPNNAVLFPDATRTTAVNVSPLPPKLFPVFPSAAKATGRAGMRTSGFAASQSRPSASAFRPANVPTQVLHLTGS